MASCITEPPKCGSCTGPLACPSTRAGRANGLSSHGSLNLLHVTNRLYKEGIFVQIRWTRCNKTSNIQCCQYPLLIRILPEEPILFLRIIPGPFVDVLLRPQL